MCGIAGLVNLDGLPADPTAVDRMIDAMLHRGPDGTGAFVDGPVGLGHLRLSILDPTPAGAQPMSRGGCVLIHNGEVYNYLELADELRALGEVIESESDTEVILTAYRVWGVDAVRRFNGMFAFALWDRDRRRLLLARDRMGVKPLYVRRTGSSFVFASEVQAFVRAKPVRNDDTWLPEPDLATVHDFLAYGKVDHSPSTFIEGVTACPPGHMVVIEDGTVTVSRYWDAPELADDARPTVRGTDLARDGQLIEEFRALFDSSVRLRLRSDVPLGTCLSGGLDSSSIVVTVADLLTGQGGRGAHEQVPRLAFHARYPDQGIDESRFAVLVAEQSGVGLHFQLEQEGGLLGRLLPVARSQGEPFGGASIMAQYSVMAAAHEQGLKVMLDGQGADELLGGYFHTGGIRIAGHLRSLHAADAALELRGQVRAGMFSPMGALSSTSRAILPLGMFDRLRPLAGGRLGIRCAPSLADRSAHEPVHDQPGTFLARRLWQSMTGSGLPALLRYEDRNSMAHGIEARVPFLDYRLVEHAVRLPDRLRINRGWTKIALRRAMAGRLPDDIVRRRDKLGFDAPWRAWMEADRDAIAALVRDSQIIERGWVEAGEVERILRVSETDRRGLDQVWRLLIVETWLRQTFPGVGFRDTDGIWTRALEEAAEATPSTGRPQTISAVA